ncbi:MAG: tail fiber protein [Bacteroidota bacterium]
MDGTIGEIRFFAGQNAPQNWVFCEGQLLPISQHQALFSLIGTRYGGDGRTSFELPDLRGRVAVGTGRGSGLREIPAGQQMGRWGRILSEANLPPHTHPGQFVLRANNQPSTTTDPTNAISGYEGGGFSYDRTNTNLNVQLADDSLEIANDTTYRSGGSMDYENYQPVLAIRAIICLYGPYPSRP